MHRTLANHVGGWLLLLYITLLHITYCTMPGYLHSCKALPSLRPIPTV